MLKRRNFFRKAVTSFSALGLLSIPAMAFQKPKVQGRFVHMVFFWLKDTTDTDQFIASTEKFLQEVEVVKAFHLGKPAGTPREVVDNSYGVALVVTFDSKEDQDAYQKHSAHLNYIEENKEKWTRVQIYDSWGAKNA